MFAAKMPSARKSVIKTANSCSKSGIRLSTTNGVSKVELSIALLNSQKGSKTKGLMHHIVLALDCHCQNVIENLKSELQRVVVKLVWVSNNKWGI